MELINKKVPSNFNVFFLGDQHIGSKLHYEKGLDRLVGMIKRPYDNCKTNYVIGMGDYIEAIDTSDKRFESTSTELSLIRPAQQMEYFVKKVEPIAKRFLVALKGNHEFKLDRYYDYVGHGLCRELDIPYGGVESVVTFWRSNKEVLKFYVHHGAGGIRSVADSPERNKTNRHLSLKRKLWPQFGDADLMAMGHTHQLMVAPPEHTLYLTSKGGQIRQHYTEGRHDSGFIPKDLRWYVNTGSMMRKSVVGTDGYAARAMYAPLQLGFPVAKIRKGRIEGVDEVIV